ncbi:uncharacterized protein LOC119601550 [Lucilia sericata]|uniref:uncharacterized protein LOC119601550 n=1 Tax=Lucilia sericata TaxID=13632 RepID=UPI0018A845E8|nr:uncharacterized protein LOC119601550 [Lucilia sericata]
MKNVNDIDFYNASSAHVGGCGVTLDLDENSSGVTNSTTRVLNNMNGAAHSRGKRFIAFPVGSSFSTAVCLTTGVVGNPDYRYLSMGLNWGIAYELPNTTWVLQHANGFGPKHKEKVVSPQIKRRHRRDLYGKLETLINGSNMAKTAMSNVSNPSSLSSTSATSSLSPILLSSSTTTSPSLLLQKQQRLLSRPKRYLSFPEGSSFSVAVCFTVGIIGNPRYNYMSFGLNWGVAYDLPNTTWILNHLHGFAKRPIPVAVWHRRSRRSLYKEIENVVDNMGYNGRDCILRALCESRQYFQKTKMGMIGEMLKVIFSLPKQRIFTRELSENPDIELYDGAYRRARSISDCSEQYDCDFSLLELAFGKYSTPPLGYYTKH